MPEIYCPHCGTGPLANKGSLNSHIRYRCKKAPPEARANRDTVGSEPPTVFESPAVGHPSAPVFETPAQNPVAAADLPGLSIDEMDRRIQALVDARLRVALAPAEERLGTLLQNATSMIEDTCNRLPGLVEKQVQGMLGGGSAEAVFDESGQSVPPAPAPRMAGAAPGNGAGALGGLGALLTPELMQLAAAFLGAEEATPAGLLKAFIHKQQTQQKKAEPLNASMMTRGAGHMISWIKNKRVDPMALARVTITEADEIMKMPGIDASTKSYWIGRKGEATNYLASIMLEKEGAKEAPAPEAAE